MKRKYLGLMSLMLTGVLMMSPLTAHAEVNITGNNQTTANMTVDDSTSNVTVSIPATVTLTAVKDASNNVIGFSCEDHIEAYGMIPADKNLNIAITKDSGSSKDITFTGITSTNKLDANVRFPIGTSPYALSTNISSVNLKAGISTRAASNLPFIVAIGNDSGVVKTDSAYKDNTYTFTDTAFDITAVNSDNYTATINWTVSIQ